MSTYVIGDVHGCLEGIFDLLKVIDYEPEKDKLFFLGDLTNKGPDSISVLKWVMQQNNCHSIIGNHDLYVLHSILNNLPNQSDTIKSIAKEKDVVTWLSKLPLLIEYKNTLLSHAGIHPSWSDVIIYNILEHQKHYITEDFLKAFYKKSSWDLKPDNNDPLFILACLTEMRFLNRNDLSLSKGTEDNDQSDSNKVAWFDVSPFNYTKKEIYFGHWARLSRIHNFHTTCLDGGYVYGGELLCKRIEDGQIFKIPNLKQKT